MEGVNKKLRVYHIPQVPMDAFYIPVANEREAALIVAAISLQHLWLEENNVIPDYSNVMGVQMFDEDSKEWEDYYNEAEDMEWDELEEKYFSDVVQTVQDANKMD